MTTFDYMELCRLCLIKDQVSVPIFEGDGDDRQLFQKICFCLPVKVNRDDKLPKKICDDCAYKVELCYQFFNTTANAEKQLMQWLGEVGIEDKQDYEQEVMTSDMMKQEQNDNRINVTVMSTEEQSNNMEINMIDGMSLSLPIIMTNQQMPAVSMSSTDNLQSIQSVAGTSVQASGNRMQKDGEEIDDTEDDNSEDECDVDDGMPVVKEESENTSGSRSMESTSYVNVSLSCNEAGPSGLQQQKLAEMGIQQSSEDNTKTGETESFGGLSGMLRQILSPSPDINDGAYLNCCNLQPGFLSNYSTMMSPAVQYIAPMSSPYLHPSHPSSMIPLEQMAPLEHLEVHTESHQCLSCGLEFRSALKLNYHIRMNHQINTNDLRRRLDTGNDNNGQIKYSCSICGRLFPNLGHLRMHESSHQQILQQQQQHQQQQQQQQHQQQQQQQQQNNVIVTNATLMSPPPDQTNDQTFNCDRCQASFRYRTLLERHKKIHLTGQDKPYTCPRCPMRFETRTLYNHHAKTHKSIIQGSTPGLVNNPSPTNNMNHVSTIPTSTSSNVMDKSSFDAPVSYPCDSCTKQFHTIESLTSHKAVHRSRPLVCDVCGKGFTHRKYYVVHQRIHTGERPYLCAMCGKSFTQASTLTVHRRYHTGERPYTCTLCGKGFVTRTIMLNHMKKH